MTTHFQSIPLSKLSLSDRNVRKTGTDEAIDDMAASIAAHGLLQSLVVQPAKRGKFAVIAGGRRLRALNLLVERGTLAKDYEVPCRVIPSEESAEELSLAENIIRAPMHPADQFEAFCAVITQGKTIADVAARFNVSEDLVERRMKLGKLSPVILQAYRNEVLDLEMAQAFALTDDQEQQESVFADLEASDQLHPRRIRAALTYGEVASSDKRVRFIGKEAYIAAGGVIRRDLFEMEDAFYVLDEALLEKLVILRLTQIAEAVKAEGWQWVTIDLDADYSTFAAYERHYPEQAKLSKKAQKKIDVLSAEYDALMESMTDDEDDMDVAKRETLQSQIDALQPADIWPTETTSISGAIVTLDHEGEPQIVRGLATQAKARKRRTAANDDATAASSLYSATLVEMLTAHKTAAIRVELSKQPEIALAAIVHGLALDMWFTERERSCVKIALHFRALPLGDEGCTALQELAEQHDQWQRRLPSEADELWPWCMAQSRDTLLHLLAYLTAQSLDAVRGKSDSVDAPHLRQADQIAAKLRVDMTRWYKPTSEGFFSRISRKAVLAAIDEATGPHGPALEKLGKAELADRAQHLLSGTNWLPEPVRIPVETEPLAIAAE